jgi:adenylate cyclase class IV
MNPPQHNNPSNHYVEAGQEIELKARVDDIGHVQRILASHHCELEILMENDRFIFTKEGSHRIRERTYHNGHVEYLEIFKEPIAKNLFRICNVLYRFVDRERFQNTPYDVEVRKKRELFKPRFSPDVIVAIDTVEALGQFVEIEGKTRGVVNYWARQLLLPPSLWILESYEDLIRAT